MSAYCDIAPGHPVHAHYHAREYGFPQRAEQELFERLLLEINQAGLSWETILRKREGFRRAYHGFDVDVVAAYGEADIARLLGDAGIIRNRLKVLAAIHNAGVIRTLREWGVRLDEALFLGGRHKGPFLEAFGADIFFDDSQHNIDSALQHQSVAAGHVPHGVANDG